MAKHKGLFGGGDYAGRGGHKSGKRSGAPGCAVVLLAGCAATLLTLGETAHAVLA